MSEEKRERNCEIHKRKNSPGEWSYNAGGDEREVIQEIIEFDTTWLEKDKLPKDTELWDQCIEDFYESGRASAWTRINVAKLRDIGRWILEVDLDKLQFHIAVWFDDRGHKTKYDYWTK